MKKTISILAALAASAAFASAPAATITNCGFADGVLTLEYTLTDDAVVTFDVLCGGDSVGGAAVVGGVLAGSDVWKRVAAENGATRTIRWRPDFWEGSADGFTAQVTAWALDNPPDYMVADISTHAVAGSQRYYPGADFVPGGVAGNPRYRQTALLMRKIMAKDVKWTMGASDSMRYVTLTNNYYMGVFEVTQSQWAQVKGDYRTGYTGTFTNVLVREMRPVNNVSYCDVRVSTDNVWYKNWEFPAAPHQNSFLGIVRTRTGIDFDLPGEAQWEFAARAGHGAGEWNNGDADAAANLNALGRYSDNGGTTSDYSCSTNHGTAVCGSYAQSDWGLYDMHGNLCEWCLDWFDELGNIAAMSEPLDYRVNIHTDDRAYRFSSGKGTVKVKKGGSWSQWYGSSKPEWRGSDAPTTRYFNIGFRVMCPVEVP